MMYVGCPPHVSCLPTFLFPSLWANFQTIPQRPSIFLFGEMNPDHASRPMVFPQDLDGVAHLPEVMRPDPEQKPMEIAQPVEVPGSGAPGGAGHS